MPVMSLDDLAELSLQAVVFDAPVVFGETPAEDLRLLRLLREATSHAVRLRWTLGGRPGFPLRTHAHLLPPVGGVDPQSEAYAARWARDYYYGSFYYRQGPGFVSVKDVRRHGPAIRMLIEQNDAAGFVAMVEAERYGDLDPAVQVMVADAVAAGLVLVDEDELLVLPYRMRHWPTNPTATS